jgi:hypothetical protein
VKYSILSCYAIVSILPTNVFVSRSSNRNPVSIYAVVSVTKFVLKYVESGSIATDIFFLIVSYTLVVGLY